MEDLKRKRSGSLDEASGGHEPPLHKAEISYGAPTRVQRGEAFTSGIEALKQGLRRDVFTQVDVPYRLNAWGEEKTSKLSGSFHTKTHTTEWTQGMLSPMGHTSYFDKSGANKVIPKNLMLNRATLESRVVKSLVLGDGYEAKATTVGASQKVDYLGGIALGSFLEDVTAKRGLNFDDVGSAMRAELMAAKWEMQSNKLKEEGFQPGGDKFGSRMLSNFPQLGNSKMQQGMGRGAAHLRGLLEGDEKQSVLDRHLGEEGSIHKAHERAYAAAKGRFDDKWAAAKENAAAAGKWWVGKDLSDGNKETLMAEYLGHKMQRHGIKQNHVAQSKDAYALPELPTPLRGEAFLGGIKDLSSGTPGDARPEVFARLELPYKVGIAEGNAKVSGGYATKTWGGTKHWTQGMLEPMDDTSYFGNLRRVTEEKPIGPGELEFKYQGQGKDVWALESNVVPEHLSWNRALVESRAMKTLSMNPDAYDPKAKNGAGFNHKDADTHHWGELTTGSFLEDVTGSRALGIHDAGSAMRARVMAAKWEMKHGGGGDEKRDFGSNLLRDLPQLGKTDWGVSNESGIRYGASAMVQQMQDHGGVFSSQPVAKYHQGGDGNVGSIVDAHKKAGEAAGAVFDKKMKTLAEGGNLAAQGNWWTKNQDRLGDLSQHANLRNEYIATKMQKHGISLYDNAGTRVKAFDAPKPEK